MAGTVREAFCVGQASCFTRIQIHARKLLIEGLAALCLKLCTAEQLSPTSLLASWNHLLVSNVNNAAKDGEQRKKLVFSHLDHATMWR